MKLAKIIVTILIVGWLFNESVLASYDANASIMPVMINENDSKEGEESLLIAADKSNVDSRENNSLEDYLPEQDELVMEESVELFGDEHGVAEVLTDGLIEEAEEIAVHQDVEELLEENSQQEDEEEIVTAHSMIAEENDTTIPSLIDDTAEDIAPRKESAFNEYDAGDRAYGEDNDEDWSQVEEGGAAPSLLSEVDYSEDEARADDALELKQQFIVASETTMKKSWSEKFLNWFCPLIAS